MARKSKEVESMGALGERIELLFDAVSVVIKEGGILFQSQSDQCKILKENEFVPPVRKNPENLKLRYCVSVLASDRVYRPGENLGDSCSDLARTILRTSEKGSFGLRGDALYRAAIIEWAKMNPEEFMSEDMKRVATDPQNILRFVKENCDPA